MSQAETAKSAKQPQRVDRLTVLDVCFQQKQIVRHGLRRDVPEVNETIKLQGVAVGSNNNGKNCPCIF